MYLRVNGREGKEGGEMLFDVGQRLPELWQQNIQSRNKLKVDCCHKIYAVSKNSKLFHTMGDLEQFPFTLWNKEKRQMSWLMQKLATRCHCISKSLFVDTSN